MCVKYYELRYMFKKIAPCIILGVRFERRKVKVDKKANLHEN